MAFQWVIKSNSFPCQSIFQTNLKKVVGFEMEKIRADLQMLEKILITGKMKSAVQRKVYSPEYINYCFII